ncbi:hypothetical protein QSJ19_02495 [Gordonia sp. ABSL11-1]|jgi:hypothetical protein|uniref:hypothetical protein n=1 Tax=Gordonia sp. ABSL11-1 TaxID=3053924 RepID=UPI00257283FA|nr:hypothetical protein [Gordonia sp. ABSL11-1]MDL9944473.1 hypothetical protein [Gordonia sp. ABSL11-1]
MNVDGTRFSLGKLVFYALGAGVLVLVVSIPIILAIAHWSPIAGLVVALLAVLAMIAAIGTVSRRMIATAEREILAARAAEQHDRTARPPAARPDGTAPPGSLDPRTIEPTDRNSATDG